MMDGFLNLWNDHAHYAWWQAVLIGLFFLALNAATLFVVWYLHRETILECGYKNAKSARKRFKQQSPAEKLLLTRLVREAPKPHFNLKLRLFLNWSNLLFAGVCFLGFLGTVATCGAGWAVMMLLCSGFFSLFLSVGICFIPDLLWVPSERRRYGLGKKKK